MTMKRKKSSLPLANPTQTRLGLPTIMERDLAAAHGSTYVHLAVFAIDIDRVYWLDPEDSTLPFGWEVFLTDYFLLASKSSTDGLTDELIESICTPLLEETPGEPPLGGQIVFAIYDAVARGALPQSLTNLFSGWKSPPRELVSTLQALHTSADQSAQQLAAYCLAADLEPPLAPPTRAALENIRSGQLRPSGRSAE
jgi:hypothetical protein